MVGFERKPGGASLVNERFERAEVLASPGKRTLTDQLVGHIQMKRAETGAGGVVPPTEPVPPTVPEGPACPEPPRRATQREVSAVIDSVIRAYNKEGIDQYSDRQLSNLNFVTQRARRFADKQRNMRKNGNLHLDPESERAERETLENAVRNGFRSASMRRRRLAGARRQQEIIQQLKFALTGIYHAATHDTCGKKPGIFEFR